MKMEDINKLNKNNDKGYLIEIQQGFSKNIYSVIKDLFNGECEMFNANEDSDLNEVYSKILKSSSGNILIMLDIEDLNSDISIWIQKIKDDICNVQGKNLVIYNSEIRNEHYDGPIRSILSGSYRYQDNGSLIDLNQYSLVMRDDLEKLLEIIDNNIHHCDYGCDNDCNLDGSLNEIGIDELKIAINNIIYEN